MGRILKHRNKHIKPKFILPAVWNSSFSVYNKQIKVIGQIKSNLCVYTEHSICQAYAKGMKNSGDEFTYT